MGCRVCAEDGGVCQLGGNEVDDASRGVEEALRWLLLGGVLFAGGGIGGACWQDEKAGV